jgi:hypothetical protein
VGGICSRYRRKVKLIKLLVGDLEVKRRFGKPRRRWNDDIKIDLKSEGRV